MKRFLFLAAFCAACLACTDEKTEPLKLAFTGDSSFSAAGTATVSFTLSKAASSDVNIFLVCGSNVDNGYKAVAIDNLSFDNKVVIKAGQKSVEATVTLDPNGLTAGQKYQAAIMIHGTSGADVKFDQNTVLIAAVISQYGGIESGDPGSGDDPGPGGDTPGGNLSLQSNWTATINSVGTDDLGDYVELKVSAPGSTYIGVTILTDEDYTTLYKGSPQEVVDAFEDAVAENLKEAAIEDCLWKESETIYVDYYESGPAYCWIIDFDANGKATGKYAKIAVDVPELEDTSVPGELKGPVSLQSNWKVTKVSEPYTYGYYDYVDIEVEAPGSTYIYPESFTAAELAYYYPGGVEEMLLDYSSDIKNELASDPTCTMADLCFVVGKEDIYINFYDAGQTDVYIMDFDATGAATGKYGVTTVTLSELQGSGSGYSMLQAMRKLRVRVHAVAPRHHRIGPKRQLR